MNLLTTAVVLGLAGLDPVGVLVVSTALAKRATKAQIIVFMTVALVGTVTVGVVASLLLESGVGKVAELWAGMPDNFYLVIDLVLAMVLLWWFARRVLLDERVENEKKSGLTKFMKYGMWLVGVIFAVTSLSDPTYLALITLAGQHGEVAMTIAACVVWILISQLPMFILVGAVMTGKHERLIEYLKRKIGQRQWRRIRRVGSIVLSAVILAAGVLLTADALSYLAGGGWLLK